MHKEQFDKEITEIEVPREEILLAIDKGIRKGQKEKVTKRKFNVKAIGTVSSIAASAFLASGLIFAPISNVLAAVPVIGPIYEKFGLQIGYELSESNLITQINQAATSNGVNITLTSAYYDGNVIGIIFHAEGDRLSLDQSREEGPEAGYSFHLFDGNEQNQWSSAMTQLEETEDGYTAAMEFYNPVVSLPADYTLPLTFDSVAGVKGLWKFDVPVQQIPLETVKSEAESVHEGLGYSLKMESVVKGKATTMLNYQTTLPLEGENDEIRLTVFDDKGNRLAKNHADVLANEQNLDVIEEDIRELFSSKIAENASYLMIQPEIIQHEENTIQSMDQSLPFAIGSNRFGYSLDVNSVEQNKEQLIIDYTVQGIDATALREDIFQSFADFIMLVRTEDVQKNKNADNGYWNIEKMMEHRVPSSPVKQMGDDPLHYQTIFNLEDAGEFDYKDYSLTVPFGTLSANQPIEMDSIKIDLTEK